MLPAPLLALSVVLVLSLAPQALAAPSGEALFTRKGCVACHTLKGHEGADGTLGPDLSRIGKDRDRGALVAWIRNPQGQKPDTRMPDLDLTQQEAETLADYLLTERPRKGKRR